MSIDTDRTKDAPLDSLEAATGYLEGLINRERQTDYAYRRLDLRPIEALLSAIDHPEGSLSIIHVAGSKGKGSTCLFAEAILLALGERVGTFTSPHLESWVERFRIDGEPVGDAKLVDAVERVRPAVEALRVGPVETRPSFFDATTAVGLLLFADAGVDRVLLEVGLGGRLDSTNAVSPEVTCITSIELEHTDKLGDTHAAIAFEKAGILKPSVPAIVGRLGSEARGVVRNVADSVGAAWIAMDDSFSLSPGDGFVLTRPERPPLAIDLATPGRAARINAALAIECVRALGRGSDAALEAAARTALSTTRLPARTEVLEGDPRVIVDAAHTAESGRALAEALDTLAPEGFDLLVSVSTDKQVGDLLAPLLGRAERVWVTRAEPARSLPADVLAKQIEVLASSLAQSVEILIEEDPELAAREARNALRDSRMLCAVGSVYLAGIARRVLRG